ncbi:asparagine-tRNA cytoplasmic-like protein, putative [Babesia caballi]|uniref:Asparagine-tRNA cytoplasmic-like protein, putative n=1 Tax=Babesia caballi TaxID=5871 RepID=A0AAV4M1U8_BABCB|nr:asparagine-tRNA cytoplasmic-like protein, putative [Babesia caballi]
MSRRPALRSLSSDKWRHSDYVTQLHNLYVRDSKEVLTRETAGASEAQAYRRTLEFYSRLCGRVTQHLEKQVQAPTPFPAECARWSYSGLFFAVLHNLENIHQKDLVALLVGLTKLLRGEHHGQYKLEALRDSVESFLACLFSCSNRVIKRVHTIAHGSDPTMNKWKSFSALLHVVTKKYKVTAYDQSANTKEISAIGHTDDGSLHNVVPEPAPSGSGQSNTNSGSYAGDVCAESCTECLAKNASETLFAEIIERSTLRKDFARIAFVLYWLSHVGFPKHSLTNFYRMMLHRMLGLEWDSDSEPSPRDLISILRYSLHFDLDSSLRARLWNILSACNQNSLLCLNLQDASSLIDCFLEAESFDHGLLVPVFTSVQLCMNRASEARPKDTSGLAHAYLTGKSRPVSAENASWSGAFIEFDHLSYLAETLVGPRALTSFLRSHCSQPTRGPTKRTDTIATARDHRLLLEIAAKLRNLCAVLEETRGYCELLIEHISHSRTTGWRWANG